MKISSLATSIFFATAATSAFASKSSSNGSPGTAEDASTLLNSRDLLVKLDAKLDAKFGDLSDKIADITSSADKATATPKKTKKNARGLRAEDDIEATIEGAIDEAVVDPQAHHVDIELIIIKLLLKLDSLSDSVEALVECVDYNSDDDICTIGSHSTNAVEIFANNRAYIGTGNGHRDNEAGIVITDAAAMFSENGRIDIDAGTNLEMRADIQKSDAVNGFAYMGTGDGGPGTGPVGYFRATAEQAKIYGYTRVDMDTAIGRLDMSCNAGVSSFDLCNP